MLKSMLEFLYVGNHATFINQTIRISTQKSMKLKLPFVFMIELFFPYKKQIFNH